ncbi:CubicO group peptidase, beta-lactamase class C family [Saccharopolyspora antimicrobica]|uniref:CubicO group peptidase (Beta-lactamase class C family) n=1 Tax=Saccharopolyspora antimicrobica TaxID=455193 RepID=A0A1I4VVK2_9PSEU|nr:serine hydrolase domain-containing protein [Saccharopolyspora antimicrobica]RKT87195.1 CubicO group peptidase (beta-lactamase class C family) [Saccharopolyspora antimicrobica]SFN05039.1 CubicO group peptidase, beta-lactamase class C family [Saccharopolyspora antimicrobica]
MTDMSGLLTEIVPPLMRRWGVPGVGVGVRTPEGRDHFGFGVTNVDHPLPVDERTLFQIGSVSKTFAATMLAELAGAGRLRLDDLVVDHLPDSGLDGRITIRHLLTHSSGLSGDHLILNGPRLLADGADDSIATGVAHIAGLPLVFAPGTDYSYSNAGLIVAGRLLEVVTGRRYADLVRTEVLEPAGMAHTFTTADEVITHRVAAPHRGEVPEVARTAGWQRGWQLPGWDVPGGGLVSCVRDMLRYAEHHLDGNTPAEPFTPQRERSGPAERIGLVWRLDDVDGVRLAHHGGLTIGYCTQLCLVPDRGTAFVLLTNGTSGDRINQEVRSALLRELVGIEPETPRRPGRAPADGTELTGEFDATFYRMELTPHPDGGAEVRIRRPQPQPGCYYLEPPSVERVEWSGPDELVITEPAAERGTPVDVRRDSAGTITGLRLRDRLAPRMPE